MVFSFFFILFVPHVLLGEGCATGTLVKTHHGYQPIEALTVGETVICCDVRKAVCYERKIIACAHHENDACIQIKVGQTILCVEHDHLFYILQERLWRKAIDLMPGQFLLNSSFELVEIEDVQKIEATQIFYDITVDQFHTLCVSKQDIIVHNFIFALPAVVWGGGIALAEGFTFAKLGTALIAAALCYSAEKATGRSLHVEVGADGTFNGGSLPFTENKGNGDTNISPRGKADFTFCSAGGGGEPPWQPRGCGNQNNNFYDGNKKPHEVKSEINQTSEAILRNGYYEVNGFRFSEYYYNRLWSTGRKAPTFIVQDILENATKITPDKYPGCFRYETAFWEMIYDPVARIVHHLAPIK